MRSNWLRILVVLTCLIGQAIGMALPFGASVCLRGLAPCRARPAEPECCCCCQTDGECEDSTPAHDERPVCPAGCDCCISAPHADQWVRSAPRELPFEPLTAAIGETVGAAWSPIVRLTVTGLLPHERPPPAACSTLKSVRLIT